MKHLMFNLLMLTGMVGSAQLDFANKLYTHKTKNGIGQPTEIKFKIYFDEEKLESCKDYDSYMKEFNYYGDTSGTKPKSKSDSFNRFLDYWVAMCLLDGKYKLKNSSSLEYLNGDAYLLVSDKDKTMSGSVPMKAQNSYGNYIVGYFLIFDKKGYVK
jgi:hypothetical protein